MTIKLGLIVLGALLIYGSWKDLSIRALIFGDNTVNAGHPIAPVSTPTSADLVPNPSKNIGGGGGNQTGPNPFAGSPTPSGGSRSA